MTWIYQKNSNKCNSNYVLKITVESEIIPTTRKGHIKQKGLHY